MRQNTQSCSRLSTPSPNKTKTRFLSIASLLGLTSSPHRSSLHDTYFVVGHFHLMIGGVTLMAIFGGIYYWFPKMYGRMMNEKLAKLHFWMTMPTFYAIFIAMHFIGFQGTPRRYFNFERYEFLTAIRHPQAWITIAAFILFAGQFLFFWNYFRSMYKGAPATENPWESATLEWTTPSPAPHGNWQEKSRKSTAGPTNTTSQERHQTACHNISQKERRNSPVKKLLVDVVLETCLTGAFQSLTS